MLEKRENTRTIKVSFAIIFFFFMSSRAVFNPFITVYMQEKGLFSSEIGYVMAINSLITIIAQPFWGIFSDRIQSAKKTLLICLILQALFATLFTVVNTFLLIAMAFILYTFFTSAEGPLLDTWILGTLRGTSDEKSFGRFKQWGCLGFALFSVLSGIFINQSSTSAVIPYFSVMLVIIAIIIALVPVNSTASKSLTLKKMQLGRILKHKEFLVLLLYMFFLQIPHRAGFTFYPVLIEQLGGRTLLVGYTSAIMFVSEAIIMYFSVVFFKRFHPRTMVMASAIFFAIWQFLYSIISLPGHVVAIALLDGPSFGLFTISVLYYLDLIAPRELRTTYQTAAFAVYFGLSGIVGNFFGGLIFENAGPWFMYTGGYLMILAATVVYFFGGRKLVTPLPDASHAKS